MNKRTKSHIVGKKRIGRAPRQLKLKLRQPDIQKVAMSGYVIVEHTQGEAIGFHVAISGEIEQRILSMCKGIPNWTKFKLYVQNRDIKAPVKP